MDQPEPRITVETVRQLVAAVDIRPEQDQYAELARTLGAMLNAIDRCDALNLAAHEPATSFRVTGGASDAEL